MIVLKKIWAFIKSYWYVPMLAIVALVIKTKKQKVSEILDVASDSHRKEVDAINSATEEKKKARIRIEQEYNDAVNAIGRVYKTQNKSLDKKKKKEIKKITDEFYNNPSEVSSKISDLFGITYVPRKNNNNTQ